MKKLELAHLAPYLPYGLKIIADGQTKSMPVYGMFKKLLTGGGIELFYYGLSGQFSYSQKEYTPLLRPISELNGNDNSGYSYSNSIMPYKIEAIINNRVSDIELKNADWAFLFEHHFDVFGLIEQGLAIDINQVS